MPVTIDWNTSTINVSKDYTTLVQSTPSEIREMNIDAFRLALRDLEDGAEGISFPITHKNNPPVTVGGVQLARVVEILEPYTITFENGLWAVNLFGANSNIADRTNVNNVSVRSSNSAGLIQSSEVENLAYADGVTIDTVNGTDSFLYPYGSRRYPCKTTANSYAIRVARGFKKIYLKSDLVLSGIPDGVLNGLDIICEAGNRKHTLTIDNVLVTDCKATNLKVTGNFKTGSTAQAIDCKIYDTSNVTLRANNCSLDTGSYESTDLVNCILQGDINIVSGGNMSGVGIVFEGDFTTIDMLNSPSTISMDIDSGYVKLINVVEGSLTEFNLRGGELELDDTVTGGDFYAEGYGTLYGDPEALGMNVKANHLLSLESIPPSIWEDLLSNYQANGTFGKAISDSTINIEELHKIGGLDPLTPATTTQNRVTAGDIRIDISGNGETLTTFTRND